MDLSYIDVAIIMGIVVIAGFLASVVRRLYVGDDVHDIKDQRRY